MDGQVWSQNLCLLSCDVVALYPSIIHDRVIHILHQYLTTFSSYDNNTKEFIVGATTWVLTHNFFNFNKDFYLEIRGVPMGGKCSPSLAGIYMSAWEADILFAQNNLYASHIKWYGRYIDDLLLIPISRGPLRSTSLLPTSIITT